MQFRLTLATSLLLLVSCDLFSTRTPEPPTGSDNQGWTFPESPEIALANLHSAMGRRSSADYIRVFVSESSSSLGYVFQPDPVTISANPGKFDNWSVTNERQHSQSLFAPTNIPLDSLLNLETTVDRQTVVGDTAIISFGYLLHVGHKVDNRPRDFEGRADFRLIRFEDGGWYVVNWNDVRQTGKACWSDLKALF
jgi:hypothetical protein